MNKQSGPFIFTISDLGNQSDLYQDELQEVLDWQNQDVIQEFEDLYRFSPKLEKLADLDFMCKDINSCNSFQNFGVNCKCFREKFSGPSEVNEYAKKYLEITKQELLDIVKGELDE